MEDSNTYSLIYIPLTEHIHDDDLQATPNFRLTAFSSLKQKSAYKCAPKDLSHSARFTQHHASFEAGQDCSPNEKTMQIVPHTQLLFQSAVENGSTPDLYQLVEENRLLKDKLERNDKDILGDLLHDIEIERSRCKVLETQIEEAKEKCENLNKEQESSINMFAEERERRDVELEALRKKLKVKISDSLISRLLEGTSAWYSIEGSD